MGSGSQEVPLCTALHSGTISWQCEEVLYFSALHLSLSVYVCPRVLDGWRAGGSSGLIIPRIKSSLGASR